MGLENLRVVSLVFLIASLLNGCALRPVSPTEEKSEAKTDEKTVEKTADEHELINHLQERVQDLETRLSALNDKINLEQGVTPATPVPPSAPPHFEALKEESVTPPAAHAHPIPVPKPKAEVFVQDESVDRYREAKILYDSKRYSDAVVEFSSFVKNYPDHTLASGAQYYVGMSYFKQKEYKLAEEEFNRELMAYPHSQFTPDTLLALSEVSNALQKPTRVLYYKEKLLSNFPHSPPSKGLSLEPSKEVSKTETPREEMTIEKPIPPTAPSVPTGEHE